MFLSFSAVLQPCILHCIYYCILSVSFLWLLYLSSSHIQMGALGHTLTPLCSVCRQFFGFIPGDVRVLQISSDDVHPIFPWPSRLSLVAPQLPLYNLTSYYGVLHSQYVSQPPQSSFFNDELQFLQPSLSPHFWLCLSTWFLAVVVGTYDELLPVFSSVWLVVAITRLHTVMWRLRYFTCTTNWLFFESLMTAVT